MRTEREGADCEYIEIMQILPGSSAKIQWVCAAYKCTIGDLQHRRPGAAVIARTLDHFCNASGALRRKSGSGFV